MKTKLKVTSYELHVFGIVAIGICLVIVSCVLGFLASDSASTGINLPVIKPLPADWNPYQRLYDELLAPTVRISSPSGIGSGVIIQGYKLQDTSCKLDNLKPVTSNTVTYVLTAAHVVENYSDVSVTFYSYSHQDTKTPSNSLCLSAFVVMTDTNKDLALIRIPPTPLTKGGTKGGISSAKLASKNYNYYLFTPVYAVGCSLGLDPRPSSGIISAIHLSDLCVSAVEISAPILPGNSGDLYLIEIPMK